MFYLTMVNKILRHCHSWLTRQYMYYNSVCFFVVLEENRPLWVKAFVPMGFRNPMKNMADMEKYLVETCGDLDYTAVKVCFGKGQNETGLKTIFSVIM